MVGGDVLHADQGKDEADLGRDCAGSRGDISPDFKGVEIWFRVERMTFFDGVGPFFFSQTYFSGQFCVVEQPRGVLIVPDVMD